MYEIRLQVQDDRHLAAAPGGQVIHPFGFEVTVAVKRELRRPLLDAVPPERVFEPAGRSGGRLPDREAVLRELFGRYEADLLPGTAPHFQGRKAREVLPHVEQMALRTRFAVLFHPVTFTYGNRRGGLWRQRPFGRLLLHDVAPHGIVESRKVPARLFEPGVVVLAAEDAVEGHGRKRIAPRGVRENAFAAAVGIGDIELHTERRRSVAVAEFHIAAAADVVHAVAQHDA